MFPTTTSSANILREAASELTSRHDTFSTPLIVSISPKEKIYPANEPPVAEIYHRKLPSAVF